MNGEVWHYIHDACFFIANLHQEIARSVHDCRCFGPIQCRLGPRNYDMKPKIAIGSNKIVIKFSLSGSLSKTLNGISNRDTTTNNSQFCNKASFDLIGNLSHKISKRIDIEH